jgi:uncharacterized repeat protein (TIGR03803 family)
MRVHLPYTFERLFAIAVVALTLSTSAYATTATDTVLPIGIQASQLIQASDGNYYGASSMGGTGFGFIFSMTSTGAVTTIYTFTGGADGGMPLLQQGHPQGNLIEGNDGNLYGTNTTGGGAGNGVLFRLTLGGSLTVLHNFATADGISPSTLIEDNAGNLFGATIGNNTSSLGTVFEYSAANVFTVLHTFTGTGGDGSEPNTELLEASDGLIYGATQLGGVSPAVGTLYRFDPANPASSFTTFASFPPTGFGQDPYYRPQYGMTEGADGALYGITEYGGTIGGGEGTIYKVTLGSVPSLRLAQSQSSLGGEEGSHAVTGLTLGGDLNFYGATREFGQNGQGSVFQYVPAGLGAINLVHAFLDIPMSTMEGGGAESGPIEGSDGNLYGVAGGIGYQMILTPPIAAPIVLTATPAAITIGQPVTLQWQVSNAFSNTASNCYAHGAWSGSQALTGSQMVVPSTPGVFVYGLTCGGVESSAVTVTVNSGVPTAIPIITPNGGTFGGPVAYSITDATPGAIIYYTTDGTVPTTSSSVWSGVPVVIDKSMTVQAIALASLMTVSAEATASFVINNTYAGSCSIPYGRGFPLIPDLQLNHGAELLSSGFAIIPKILHLTYGLQNEYSSAYYKKRIPLQAFVTEFTFAFEGANASSGDGLAFVVQADNLTALGADGEGLGFVGIPHSMALEFNLFSDSAFPDGFGGPNSVSLAFGGSLQVPRSINLTPSGINLHSGHAMDALVTYDSLYLTLDLKDMVTGIHFKHNFRMPEGNPFGATTAYAGFTAATGTQTSKTLVGSWSLESAGVCQ